MDKVIEHTPAIIEQAAKSPLGLFALMIITLSILGFFFFRTSSERTRIGMFVLMFSGVVSFGIAIFHKTSNISPNSPYKVGLSTLGISEKEFRQLYDAILLHGFIGDDRSSALQKDQSWLAKKSTVFYYDDANLGKAKELADLMEHLTGIRYGIVRGGGANIDPKEYGMTLMVHYIKD